MRLPGRGCLTIGNDRSTSRLRIDVRRAPTAVSDYIGSSPRIALKRPKPTSWIPSGSILAIVASCSGPEVPVVLVSDTAPTWNPGQDDGGSCCEYGGRLLSASLE